MTRRSIGSIRSNVSMLAICPDQIERFYAGNLPPSKGMTINFKDSAAATARDVR